jgi:hypothetical protein
MSTPPPSIWDAYPVDPTNPDLLLNIAAYLIELGFVRDPDTPDVIGSPLPPLWIAPRYGCPAPGETPQDGNSTEIGVNTVVSMGWATGIAPKRYEGFLRDDGVEFFIRSISPQVPMALDNQIRGALNDRRGWVLNGAVIINESLLTRPIQLLSSDEQGWTYHFEYLFNTWGTMSRVEG